MNSDTLKRIFSDWEIQQVIIFSLVQCNGFPSLVQNMWLQKHGQRNSYTICLEVLMFETTDNIILICQ